MIRAAVLIEAGMACQVRIDGLCTGTATHVHHTLGRDVTGDDPRYLVAACAACNLHIGDPATHPTDCPRCASRQPTPRTEW